MFRRQQQIHDLPKLKQGFAGSTAEGGGHDSRRVAHPDLILRTSLGNFIVPDILGGAKVLMIGNLVEQQFLSARNWPFGAALSVMIMVVMFLMILIYLRRIGRTEAGA